MISMSYNYRMKYLLISWLNKFFVCSFMHVKTTQINLNVVETWDRHIYYRYIFANN